MTDKEFNDALDYEEMQKRRFDIDQDELIRNMLMKDDKPVELTKEEVRFINIHSLSVNGKKLLNEDWPGSDKEPPYILTYEEKNRLEALIKDFHEKIPWMLPEEAVPWTKLVDEDEE